MVYDPEYAKRYREAHKEQIKKSVKKWYESHKDNPGVKERRKKYFFEYRQKNREIILKKKKQYREKNKEKVRIHAKEYYEENKEELKRKTRERIQKTRMKCLIHYGGNPPKCACCGEMHVEFLTFDHIEGNGRKHREEVGIGNSFYRWLIKENFPDGLQILCYNCNCAIGHYGRCPHDNQTFARD